MNRGISLDHSFPDIIGLFEMNYLLLTDAMRCAGAADTIGFEHDAVDALRLGRLRDDAPFVFESAVGAEIENEAYRAIAMAVSRGGIYSSTEAQRLLTTIDALPEAGVRGERAIDIGERWVMLDICCYVSIHGTDQLIFAGDRPGMDRPASLARRLENWLRPIPMDGAMLDANRRFDEMTSALHIASFQTRHAEISRIEGQLLGAPNMQAA